MPWSADDLPPVSQMDAHQVGCVTAKQPYYRAHFHEICIVVPRTYHVSRLEGFYRLAINERSCGEALIDDHHVRKPARKPLRALDCHQGSDHDAGRVRRVNVRHLRADLGVREVAVVGYPLKRLRDKLGSVRDYQHLFPHSEPVFRQLGKC